MVCMYVCALRLAAPDPEAWSLYHRFKDMHVKRGTSARNTPPTRYCMFCSSTNPATAHTKRVRCVGRCMRLTRGMAARESAERRIFPLPPTLPPPSSRRAVCGVIWTDAHGGPAVGDRRDRRRGAGTVKPLQYSSGPRADGGNATNAVRTPFTLA